jgi:predicted acetyltransferase
MLNTSMLVAKKASHDDKAIIANLMELYIYDLSKIVPNINIFHLDAHGRYGYPRFDSFWTDADRAAYLFLEQQELVGFCLTHSNSFFNKGQSRVVGEFFILYPYRNRGYGTELITQVMQATPGYWEMRVIDDNTVALAFWEKVLKTVAPNSYVIHNKYDAEWFGKVYVGKVN